MTRAYSRQLLKKPLPCVRSCSSSKLADAYHLDKGQLATIHLPCYIIKIPSMKHLKDFALVFLLGASGCQADDGDCSSYKSYIESKSCAIVILKQNNLGKVYAVEGYNPSNKTKASFEDEGGLYVRIRQAAVLGDTLVKPLGKPYFLVKKRAFNIKFEIKCDSTSALPSPADTIPKS
jgi:hypothetical protein